MNAAEDRRLAEYGLSPRLIREWRSVQRSYGPDASNDARYRHFFVRDFQVAREHTQTRYPEIALRGLDHCLELQATGENVLTEARRGRFPHEHGTRFVDGEEVSTEMQTIIKKLSADWGGTEEELLYYGAEDTTPLTIIGGCQFYLELGAWYKKKHGGEDYFDGKIKNHDEETITRRESIFRGLEHLTDRIQTPAVGFKSIGLLGFKRVNPKGHNNQVWMDSPASYMRPNGELPNYDGPIYAIELQGYAYDAYMYSFDVFGEQEPDKARVWKQMADTIQRETFERFWMSGEKFFAMGLDHDPQTGAVRQIEVKSINVGELLKSRIFDTIPEVLSATFRRKYDVKGDLQEYFVGNSWLNLIDQGFVTPAGLRCRDLNQRTPITYAGYHNENFVWIKASHNAARAGRKWGFTESADKLDILLTNYVNIAGDNLELVYVDNAGRVDYDPKRKRELPKTVIPVVVPVESIPDATQTWTISSTMDIERERKSRDMASEQVIDSRPDWVRRIDKVATRRIPDAKLLITPEEIEAAFPTNYAFRLDPQEGRRRRREVLKKIYGGETAAHSF